MPAGLPSIALNPLVWPQFPRCGTFLPPFEFSFGAFHFQGLPLWMFPPFLKVRSDDTWQIEFFVPSSAVPPSRYGFLFSF